MLVYAFTFKTYIPGVILIEPRVFGDDRGFFMETYKHSDFASAGIKESFVQDNYSRSLKGILRGLHYQKNPNAQGKLVQCIAGRIFDAAVDIRKGSPSFGKWVAAELSGDNRLMLYVPAGFAHGFLVLSETADVMYKCTKEYSPADDRGIIWSYPENRHKMAAEWTASIRQRQGTSFLKDADNNLEYL